MTGPRDYEAENTMFGQWEDEMERERTPEAIPPDIMQAAQKHCSRWCCHGSGYVEMVAAAMVAERGRCERVARGWFFGAFTGWVGKTGRSKITLDRAEEILNEAWADCREDIMNPQEKPAT